MVTPRKSSIIEKAFEINAKQNHNISTITPTESEMKENGMWKEARDSLMTDQDRHEYRSYVEREARSLGLIEEGIQLAKQTKPYPFEIDIEEALRSGVFISGGKGQCKTNLSKIIADRMLQLGHTVKALDISKAWLKSSIPHFYEVKSLYIPNVDFYKSIVYDLSRLTPKELKKFIAKFLEKEWNQQIAIPEHRRKWIIYVFEECQMLVPQGSLRSNEAQQTLRIMTSGRNFNIGFIALTQRSALTHTSVFELSFQRYFARMDGENDKHKVAQYIGSLAEKLEDLNLGEFFYDFGRTTKWIHTEEFKPKTKPRKLSMPTIAPLPQLKPKPKSPDTKALSSIVLLLLWLCILWIALR